MSLKMDALCDYENMLLSTYDTAKGIPVGMERLTHESWVQHVKDDLPRSDFTWQQYVEYVEAGGGDEWFLLDPAAAATSWTQNGLPLSWAGRFALNVRKACPCTGQAVFAPNAKNSPPLYWAGRFLRLGSGAFSFFPSGPQSASSARSR